MISFSRRHAIFAADAFEPIVAFFDTRRRRRRCRLSRAFHYFAIIRYADATLMPLFAIFRYR